MAYTAFPLLEGLLLGLATGPACLLSCGPVYAPYLMQKSRGAQQSISTLLQISGGRLTMYIAIGCMAGALGKQFGWLEKSWFAAASYLIFSTILIISAWRSQRCDVGCATGRWMRFADYPFILGLATGISVCPSFFLAITRTIDHGGAFAGALLFAAFFIGTNVYFLPFIIFGMIGKTYRLRIVARFLAFGVALWFIGQALMLLISSK